ncbi:DUF6239 family natural product biosynthesis protein [Umezawaea beigongshangensis]|uniref:DUF6239 family natural product biosynthesis protein n=1 Tax=Umezawaea beigongshangensis TaxID=2780383 RepID=UPI0018F235E0|nr:DUF6239 family natural product biosynthesis protein [Umezawaea beigongshangensis]
MWFAVAGAALGQHGHDVAQVDGSAWATAVRVPVLGALVVLVGTVLLRSVVPSGRVVRVVAAGGAVVVVAGEALLTAVSPRPLDGVGAVVVPLALAVAAVVAVVAAPRRLRTAPLVAGFATVLALGQLGRVPVATAGERVALVQAALLTGVAALAWFAVAPVRRAPAAHAVAVAVALAVLAGTAQLTAVEPWRPVAGVPQVRDVALGGAAGRVLVAPQRPGWNLVQVAEAGTEVGVDPARLVPAAPRPGAGGAWALVELPEGRSTLLLRRGGELSAVPVDTGTTVGPDLTSPDGPECAGAAVGALVAGRVASLESCPADHLDPADADALRAVVAFVAGRGNRGVTLVADDSPRSVAAAEVVLDAARLRGTAVTRWPASEPASTGPVLVVAGWAGAERALRAVATGELPGGGSYVAPWLLTAPLLTIPAGQLVPLRTGPQEPEPLRYVAALRAGAPDATASAAGYAAWRGAPDDRPARLYAASSVTVQLSTTGHAHGGATWFPGGAVTPVSGPLDGT